MSLPAQGRYWILAGGIASFVVATYLVFNAFGFDRAFHVDPRALDSGAWAALGLLFLVADVFLPVPSSLVMIANGAVLGVAGGAILSMAGRVAAFAAGYWIGSRGLRRFAPADARPAQRLLSERAWIGIVVTRPIPVLSETVAIMAGAAALPFGRSLAAALLGSIPESIVLAAAGSAVLGGDGIWIVVASLTVIVALYRFGKA